VTSVWNGGVFCGAESMVDGEESLSSQLPQLESYVINEVVSQSVTSLKAVNDIPRLYRRTNRDVTSLLYFSQTTNCRCLLFIIVTDVECMGVGHLLLPAQLPGTHWAIICVIRRLALTVGCFQSLVYTVQSLKGLWRQTYMCYTLHSL